MTTQPTIVVVEDDPHIADLVELYLRRDGYRVLQATTGARALELVEQRSPALLLVDIGLPGSIDGFEVCRRIRQTNDVPIIIVTARDDEIDRIIGLELGADDYVSKPFSPRELVARVKAVLRRTDGARRNEPAIHRVGAVTVDTARREATVGDRVVALATREFDLLQYFAENRGMALSRRQLLDGAWGHDWVGDERTVDVHVRQLRRKLGDGLPLTTVWGVGYRLD